MKSQDETENSDKSEECQKFGISPAAISRTGRVRSNADIRKVKIRAIQLYGHRFEYPIFIQNIFHLCNMLGMLMEALVRELTNHLQISNIRIKPYLVNLLISSMVLSRQHYRFDPSIGMNDSKSFKKFCHWITVLHVLFYWYRNLCHQYHTMDLCSLKCSSLYIAWLHFSCNICIYINQSGGYRIPTMLMPW